ncbi:hypothetical protein [Luteolibacter marinus]|uniref:hypothetical protein n=1 Tax=Luteolibacter marinus TaxID=2776705 RepID=UPI001D0273C5|nr:hypothetical protein [Luteolibacter marinus]
MIRRYEIQEIVSQDSHGVVFHAVDRETDADVVLRRFFPFGPDGGGLEGEEREAYGAAIERLKAVKHPTLRTILDGGCDPVDGMPYLVTEWLDGTLLSDHLRDKPLSPGSTKALLDHALEASQMLAKALGEEAVWVETEPETVILSSGTEGRGVTFWISPLRWLGGSGDRKSLAPLVGLGEAAMHWQGRVISAQAGEGLGAWFKAITADPGIWTLEEARATLHAAANLTGSEPQTIVNATDPGLPTVPMKAPAAQPKLKQKSSPWPIVVVALLVLAMTGLLVWKKMHPRTPAIAGVSTTQVSSETPAPSVEAPATPATPKKPSRKEEVELLAARLAAEASQSPNNQVGKEVILEGTIRSAEKSQSGATLYLEFAVEGESATRWASFLSSEWKDLSLEKMQAMVGSQARFRGAIRREASRREFLVFMGDPGAFTPLPAATK